MDLKIFTNNIEQTAIDQINLLLEQEAFKDCKIRIMPDVHAGAGCVIGFTGNLGDKVIPNIVGVDIGCGMLCVELGKIDIDLAALDDFIKNNIPSGFEVHTERKVKFNELQNLKCFRDLKDTKRLERSIGTLGGGNHFIEIDVDDKGNKYLIVHTGSRNLGKQVAEYYQELANQLINYDFSEYQQKKKDLIEDYKKQGRKKEIQKALEELKKEYLMNKNKIPKDLAYLEGQYKDDYLHDMAICQLFAHINRVEIVGRISAFLLSKYARCIELYDTEKFYDKRQRINVDMMLGYFETVHNYISFDDNIVRKGAISAQKGEKLLIPINMRDGCIIGIGKGNEDWNCSAPHGAGRIMSRAEAREKLNVDDFKNTMDGIYTTTANETTIDEAPMAYKPMQEIIDNIKDTVEIIKIIKPIYNFKASE